MIKNYSSIYNLLFEIYECIYYNLLNKIIKLNQIKNFN